MQVYRLAIMISVVLVALVLAIGLAQRSNLIRDTGTFDATGGAQRSFSLSRSQMLLWTFNVLLAFLLVWFARGQFNQVVSDGSLALLGISTGTAFGGSMIDQNQPPQEGHDKVGPSRGFWRDILSDAHGINLHRFQLVLWTLALTVVFWSMTLNILNSGEGTVALPDFDSKLLILMGISGGAYLGLKVHESPVDAPTGTASRQSP
jgi:hypothetical protein